MTRRERTLKRIDSLDPEFTRAWLRRDWMAAAIEAYAAELAADLESDRTIDQLIQNYWSIIPLTNAEIVYARAQMRAALRTVLEE